MIEFKKIDKMVILMYIPDYNGLEWVYRELKKNGEVKIAKAFSLTKNDLISSYDECMEKDIIKFKVAEKIQDYYRFPKEILSLKHDLYIHESVSLKRKLFVAERGIAIFPKLDNLLNKPIYIGGNNNDKEAIPETVFKQLIKQFPNTYELNRYAEARIDTIISSYIETNKDYNKFYQKYINKKISKKGKNLINYFSQIELEKYKKISEKTKEMLENEISYSEKQWQDEILQIILLLYPKYIYTFKEVPIRDIYKNHNRYIDFVLIDASGNIDVVEIKKPFDQCIVTNRTYRDNHVPLRELSGTVMQIEKYIFYLNKWGKEGEKKLTEYYKNYLPENFKIKITNPNALIIMGRTKGLSEEQKLDFEVIKRKYKNVIDIITYDDLIQRLETIIKTWTVTYNKII